MHHGLILGFDVLVDPRSIRKVLVTRPSEGVQDNAIASAVNHKNIDLAETLIIVTADHSHVFTIAGYPTRGKRILGKVISNDSAGNPEQTPALDLNDMPYTTVGYTNGQGVWLEGTQLDKNAAGRVDGGQFSHLSR